MLGNRFKVEECVDYSFAEKHNFESENEILKEDRDVMTAQHLKIHPAVTINK